MNTNEVKLNEEIEISYRYAGEGRFFKKPEHSQFIFTSGPLVEHKTVAVNEGSLRETILTYTLCPLTTGLITISPAVITVNQKEIRSNAATIKVNDNSCFYCKKEKAGNFPHLMELYIERESSRSRYRKKTIFNHKICIPRSDYALYYHRTGHILKIAFTILGVLIAISRGSNFIIGLGVGSLCGGLVCQLMYRMADVKPQFYYSLNYKSVKDLFAKGYQLGDDPGLGILNTKFVHLMAAMLR